MLRLLIAKKAKINHTDKRGETALFAAGRAGCLACFKSLVKAGAKQNHKNKKGKTLLDILSRLKPKKERSEIVRLLSRKKAK